MRTFLTTKNDQAPIPKTGRIIHGKTSEAFTRCSFHHKKSKRATLYWPPRKRALPGPCKAAVSPSTCDLHFFTTWLPCRVLSYMHPTRIKSRERQTSLAERLWPAWRGGSR